MNRPSTPPRSQSPGRYLGLGFLIVGACFLFDPFISVFDVLPDFIGYIFFYVGLYRLSDLDDRLAEAARGAWRLALVGLGRPVALFLVFGLVSASEQPMFILLAVFTLAVLDALVLIPLWKNLGGGLLYLGSRHDATCLFERSRRGSRTVTERYVSFSIVFFLLREVMAVLPELSVLTGEEGGVDSGHATQFYDFIGLFREVSAALTLVVGIVWLVMTIRFIRRLWSDTPFLTKLSETYRKEVLVRHDLFAMRAVKASFACLFAAAVLSIDIYLDGINVLPDGLAAVFLALSVLFLRRYTTSYRPALAVTVAYGLTSVAMWVMQWRVFSITDIADILERSEVYARWQTMLLVQQVVAILFVMAVLLILRTLYGLIQRYTGVRAFRDGDPHAADRTKNIHRHLRNKLITVGVLAVLTAASTLVHWGLVPLMPELILKGEASAATTILFALYNLIKEAYALVDIALGIALVGVVIHTGSEVSEQMEYSYMMR